MITTIEKLISSNISYTNKLTFANFGLFTINKDRGRLIDTMDLVLSATGVVKLYDDF
uniref:Uncharacterized protein n=1 Tax=Lepeophtheirus salmonis TaxID=72036 RepID=A0A0K2TUZ1_LEPSM